MKRIIKEFLGTTIMILLSCGIAATSNIILATSVNIPGAFSLLTIAISIGVSYYIAAFIFDNCNLNPIFTIQDMLNKKIKIIEGIEIILSELLGGFFGAELLGLILQGNYGALGANGYGNFSILGANVYQAFAVEFIVSLILCLVYNKTNKDNHLKNITITIILISLFAIPYTNAGANPARSVGPAIMMGEEYLKQLWLFIIAPILGSLISFPITKLLTKKN